MSHPAQRQFFQKVKEKFPQYFKDVEVIDFGSLDVNGTLKALFQNSKYTGVDIHDGRNVDVVSAAHQYYHPYRVQVVVSGEMLEHDEFWKDSLLNMYNNLKNGGLMAISAAGPTRAEHGTSKTSAPENQWGSTADYYRNISKEDLEDFAKTGINCLFKEYAIELSESNDDIYFWGIK
jgi:hypothetical protein